MSIRRSLVLALALLLIAACGKDDPSKPAASGKPSSGTPAGGYGFSNALGDDLDKKAGDALKKAKEWLLAQRDATSGSWGKKTPVDTTVGFTALATLGAVAATPSGAVAADPAVLAGLDYVVANQKENGAIFGNPAYTNYETSAAVAALSTARVSKFASAQAKARDFLVSSQIQGDEAAPSFGGFPYKAGQSADLSNLQFAVTALHDAGVPPEAPVFQRVQKYLARVQNRSETNTAVVKAKQGDEEVEVVSADDGGGIYMPGDSKAGLAKRKDGKYFARSYGSMTYALLKCLLFSGAKADDPRVVAAVGWISKNFAVDRNPGFESSSDPAKMGMQGYFYYLRTMARALAEFERATGKPLAVTDANGKTHDWRREIVAAVTALQRADGSWVNDKAERWEEGNPLIATSYAMETLATCQGRLP